MFLRKIFPATPAVARVAPFLIFAALTVAQGRFGPAAACWLYFAKTVIGAWLILEMWPLVKEMRWAFSGEAIGVGVAVFALWVGISGDWTAQTTLWAKLGWSTATAAPAPPWNPKAIFGADSALAWLFIVIRIVGSTLVVPPLEEVFYRSFIYRYIARADFLSVPLNQFLPVPFLLTALAFGLSHNEWLAGILCGAAYQWLVIRKNRLGDAMTAHAITNLLLGVWVVWKGAWNFW